MSGGVAVGTFPYLEGLDVVPDGAEDALAHVLRRAGVEPVARFDSLIDLPDGPADDVGSADNQPAERVNPFNNYI